MNRGDQNEMVVLQQTGTRIASGRGEGTRNPAISFTRLISMLLIITCHIMQYCNMELAYWFNIGVQIFLCVSGYLYGDRQIKNVKDFYYRRFIKILKPYYVVFIAYGTLLYFFFDELFDIRVFLRGLFLNRTLSGAGHLWFVPLILMCYMITPLLEVFRDNYVCGRKSLILFVSLSAEIAVVFFFLFAPFYNPIWICCYILGYGLAVNANIDAYKERTIVIIFGVLAALGGMVQCYYSYVINSTFIGYQYFCNLVHLSLGIFLFLMLKIVISRIQIDKRFTRTISFSDEYSYEIYLVHQILILSPFSLMEITPFKTVNIAAILIMSIALAYVVKRITQIRWAEFLLGSLRF